MANKVLLKKSSVAAKVPVAADLDYGELALNYQDGKIYYKKADNSIDSFSSAVGSVAGVASVAGNTGAVTATQLITAINTVDGSGSGLDADLLDGINGASLIRSDTADTFLDITSENGIESLKVGGYSTTAAIQASYSTSFAAQPMASEMWHDLLAFQKNYTTSFETYNGTAWTFAISNQIRELFAQKENQSTVVIDGTAVTAARWTFTDVGYSSADWLVIGHAYSGVTPNKTVLVESSTNGTTWSTKHTSTYNNHAVSMFHRLNPYYGDAYLRVTITWVSGGDIRLSNIKLLTCRPGDQGRGSEQKYPYIWDWNQNITTGGNLTIAAGKTFSSPTSIVSTLATGTAPFTVASTTLVSNLNSQYLNGQLGSYYLDTSATAQTKTGDLTITGNLTVNGTTTTVNSTVLTIDDINIELGSIASPTDTTANGGGITLKGATDKTFNWVQSTGYWTANNSLSAPQHISTVAQGTAPLIVTSTTLVSNLNSQYLNGQLATYYIDTSSTAQTKAGNLTLTGALSATTKSFLIKHPIKPNMMLRYGSLEGPENGVYLRGRLKGNKIELPDYWTKLIDPESITVSLTSIGKHQDLYVKSIENNTVTIANGNLVAKGIDCFYVVYGERCDVDKLQVEIAN
jgi:archaellum component FlaG (FlaF/FlaG flagellin family)